MSTCVSIARILPYPPSAGRVLAAKRSDSETAVGRSSKRPSRTARSQRAVLKRPPKQKKWTPAIAAPPDA